MTPNEPAESEESTDFEENVDFGENAEIAEIAEIAENTENTEIAALQERLASAEETLRAIRAGEVDAILVTTQDKEQLVYILETPDLPYRRLVEGMSEGAALVDAHGLVTYANQPLATLLGVPLERLLGRLFSDWLDEPDRPGFTELLAATPSRRRGEQALRLPDGGTVTVLLGITVTEESDGSFRYLTATDLSEQARQQEEVRRLNGELTSGLDELRLEQAKALERLEGLEQFQRLTVGRELRMIELKKEVEYLKSLGQSGVPRDHQEPRDQSEPRDHQQPLDYQEPSDQH